MKSRAEKIMQLVSNPLSGQVIRQTKNSDSNSDGRAESRDHPTTLLSLSEKNRGNDYVDTVTLNTPEVPENLREVTVELNELLNCKDLYFDKIPGGDNNYTVIITSDRISSDKETNDAEDEEFSDEEIMTEMEEFLKCYPKRMLQPSMVDLNEFDPPNAITLLSKENRLTRENPEGEEDWSLQDEIVEQLAVIIHKDEHGCKVEISGAVRVLERKGNYLKKWEEHSEENHTPHEDSVGDNCVLQEGLVEESGDIQGDEILLDNDYENEINVAAACQEDLILKERVEVENTRKSRGKKASPAEWMKNVNKISREHGQEYFGTQKKGERQWDYTVARPSRELKPTCDCKLSKTSKILNCRLMTEDDRKIMFQCFWKNLGWDEKKVYIQGLVDVVTPVDKKHCKNEVSRRNSTLRYFLRHKSTRIRVCKTYFLNTLDLSDWQVLQWVAPSKENQVQEASASSSHPESSYYNSSDKVSSPKRNSKRHRRSTSSDIDRGKVNYLKNFLNKLPKMESHYCRKDSKKLYLEPIFQTKTEVYQLYKEHCTEQQKPIASLKTFYVEFSNLNLAIFCPRKDQCDLCCSYEAGNVSQELYDHHIAQKNSARAEKTKDNNSNSVVLTVDLEAVLLCPRLKASALYFKTKLIVHNFTIFNNQTHDGYCYTWHEGEGGITANEFASVLLSFIENELKPQQNEEIIIWSDNCGYQNKNSLLANALLYLATKLNITVIQKYLERGHTEMECDAMHACIERKLRNKKINVPADYVTTFQDARKSPSPYKVSYLSHTFFQDFSSLKFLTSIRPRSKPGDPTVAQLKCLKYTPDKKIQYKLQFDDDWSSLEKRKRSTSAESPVLQPLYRESLKIKSEKYKHLQELKDVIHSDYYSFYDNLRH